MNRTLLASAAALAALAAACGDVKERADCRSSAGCPAGQYCARTSEGNVCWPDAVPPTAGGVTVVCGTDPCPRDGTLLVTASATDDKELLAVEATIDLAPGRVFPLAPGSGSEWTGTIDLATVPFPAFTRELLVTVVARDGARNEASAVAGAGQRPVVTRLRWEYAGGASLSPAAITADGTVVVARSALTDQVLAVNADGTKAWSRSLGSGTVTAPPSIGAQAIWVGANDGKLYAVAPDGSAELASRSCTASGVARGPPAILTTGGTDVAFGAFSNGRIYASGPTCVPTAETPGKDPYTSGVAVDGDGGVYGATSTLALKAVRRYVWDGEALGASWVVDVGDAIDAPFALAGTGIVVTGSTAGELERTTVGTGSGSVAALATLSGSIDESPIILSNGDIVVGDASGKLHRLDSNGTAVWDPPVDLGAAVHAPMALKPAGGSVWFLVATVDGKVHAVDGSGAILWSGPLTGGTALGAGNIHTPAGSDLSTAYFGGADGKLYAVIVDGALDTAAPWPKAWHDARNTSRAGGGF
jgi:hypothetical protein